MITIDGGKYQVGGRCGPGESVMDVFKRLVAGEIPANYKLDWTLWQGQNIPPPGSVEVGYISVRRSDPDYKVWLVPST